MAALPVPNSVAAGIAANTFGVDLAQGSCVDDPNFATICSFLQNFGELIRVGSLPFDDLQQMLESTGDVPLPLVQLHITLLRRVFKAVTTDKWERSLAKFGHMYCSQDAWEVERFGYKRAKIQTKLRLLKNLLEAQFDFNVKFKAEVNKLQAADLRLNPLGRDTEGQVYWYQVDGDANLRVYREDIDDETWEIVASNKDEFVELISQLQRGEVKKPEPEETIILPEEDSNSKDAIEPKEIILDTGKVEDDVDDSEDSVVEEERKMKTVEPLVLKQHTVSGKSDSTSVEFSVVDKVTREVSILNNPESDSTGIKLVFGVKSKPKVGESSPHKANLNLSDTLTTKKLKPTEPLQTEERHKKKVEMPPTDLKDIESSGNNVVEQPPLLPQSTPPKTEKVSNSSDVEKMQDSAEKELNLEPLVKTGKEARESPSESLPKITSGETLKGSKECAADSVAPPSIKTKEPPSVKRDAKRRRKEEECKSDPKSSLPPKDTLKSTLSSGNEHKEKESKNHPTSELMGDSKVLESSQEIASEAIRGCPTFSKPLSPVETLDVRVTEKTDACRIEETAAPLVAVNLKTETSNINSIHPEAGAPCEDLEKVKEGEPEISPYFSEVKSPKAEVMDHISPEQVKKNLEQTTGLTANNLTSEKSDTGTFSEKTCVNVNNDNKPATLSEEEAPKKSLVVSFNKPENNGVVEEIITKSTSWVCGGKDVSEEKSVEEVIVTESAYVCESEPAPNQPALETQEFERSKSNPNPVKDEKVESDSSPPMVIKEDSLSEIATNPGVNEEMCKIEKGAAALSPPKVIKEESLGETTSSPAVEEGACKNEKVAVTVCPPMVVKEESLGETTSIPAVEEETYKNVKVVAVVETVSEDPSNLTKSSLVSALYSDTSEDSKDACDSSLVARATNSEPKSSCSTKKTNEVSQHNKDHVPSDANMSDNSSISAKQAPLENVKHTEERSEEAEVIVTATKESENGTSSATSQLDLKLDMKSAKTHEESNVTDLNVNIDEKCLTEVRETPETVADVPTHSRTDRNNGHPNETTVKESTEGSEKTPSFPQQALHAIQEEALNTTTPTSSEAITADKNVEPVTSEKLLGSKRKSEEGAEPASKIPKLDESSKLPLPVETESMVNPIVGETIEEEVMTIVGEGSGALNEGSNENSPVALAVAEMPGSQDGSIESEETEESRDTFPARGRGGRRGRGRRGRPAGVPSTPRNSQPSSTPRGGSRGLREVARLGVSLDVFEVNGENDRPVRASRRIAQIRLKEEEERRKLEEERLAQLKAAQMKKKEKQAEKEKNCAGTGTPTKGKRGPGKKSELAYVPDYVPSASDSDDKSGDEEDGSDDFSEKLGKGGKRRRRRKNGNGKVKKGGRPWATSSEEEDEEAVEEEEEYHYEEEEEELVFKSDHEFSPESDLGEDGDFGPSRHARTAKQDKGDLFEEGNCCKCGKGDHPEWILLCDKCDKGWHASCLRPQLWVVPEGEWFCPPCQHNMLIDNLSKNLVEYESLLKKRENEILRKQRLAYVGISLNNVLPDKEKSEIPEVEPHDEKSSQGHDKKKQRRRILSDEDEMSDDFINDNSDDDLSGSRSNSSEDSDEPVYRLRARRSKKAFDFKEYDDMINSALRVDDDEEAAEGGIVDVGDEGDDEEDGGQLNGDEAEEHVGGGKNEAYLKHLEMQAQEEEETDEELLDEKERLRRKELKKSSQGQRKARRRINDLDAYSEEEDSDDDFKASEADDDEEELGDEGESEWSGDKMEEDSDDSIAKRARRKERHGRLGRREKYSDKGLVRRSTRKRKSRISYDESDDDDDEEEDQHDKWQSGEESDEASESNSESDDSTWGKKKRKGFAASKPKMSDFVLGAPPSGKGKGKGGVKRKRRKIDDDDEDRPWNSARGKKQKDEPVERRTRGRKINFKDILDSGESDDEGNVRPKRRPLSDSDDSRSPSCSRKLAEEIRAENARQAKQYEESQKKPDDPTEPDTDKDLGTIQNKSQPQILETTPLPSAELSDGFLVNSKTANPKITPIPSPAREPPASPSKLSNSPVVSAPLSIIPNSSSLAESINVPPQLPVPSIAAALAGPAASSLSTAQIPPPLLSTSAPLPLPPSILTSPFAGLVQGIPPPPIVLPKNMSASPFPLISSTLNLPLGLPPSKSIPPLPPTVPAPATSERKSKSKGSRSSRGSKSSDKQSPVLKLGPSDLELALSKPLKNVPLPPTVPPAPSKSSSKKRDSTPINVPNPSLLMANAMNLSELLNPGMGLPPQAALRSGLLPSSGSGSSKKESRKSSGGSTSRALTSPQQTTPPPVSQNLSPSLPIDIDRVPNPALFQGAAGIRPFHHMWLRNPGPPPGYGTSGGSVSSGLGKPPPLNTSPFSGQQGPPPPRPGYPSPPPLRIPNPSPFQHFKRDNPLGGPLYRLPPGQPQPGVPLSNILPGLMSPHSGGPERFFGAPSPYPNPYGLLPPHAQGQHPQALFPFDYRPPELPFKEEIAPPRTTSSSSIPTPVSSSSSPPPVSSAAVPLSTKEEGPTARDSEFGGLVSYFSSQRSEEDMDT